MKKLVPLLLLLLSAPILADISAEVPDFCQRNSALPRGGSQYCAPVAVSNTFSWLAQKGFPRLAKSSQLETIKSLAKAMGTDNNGTSALELVTGIKKYLSDAGYKGKVVYQGWRSAKNRKRGNAIVGDSFLQSGIGRQQGLWANFGWYSEKNGNYQRRGGHWVTVVGVQTSSDKLTLEIHDPSPRSGTQKSKQTVELKKLHSGELTGKIKGLPRSAAGYYKVTRGLKISKKHDAAILDGAVVLRLKLSERSLPSPLSQDFFHQEQFLTGVRHSGQHSAVRKLATSESQNSTLQLEWNDVSIVSV